MTPTDLIELEIAYTGWAGSCKDPLPADFRECRRPKGHDGPHASGHTANGSYME